MLRERLHEPAIDIAFDAVAEQMGPLSAQFDQIGAIGPGWNRGAKGVECDGRIAVAVDPLPELPDFDRGCDLVARRDAADPAGPAVGAIIAAVGLAIERHRPETCGLTGAVAPLLERGEDGADIEERP